MTQGELLFIDAIAEIGASAGPIAVQFEAFHAANPHVLSRIIDVALELKGRGWQKAGMKMIFERLRWLYAIQTTGETFKLNNNYTSMYARMVMDRVPQLAGFFETRILKTESK